jgi:NADH dehydrogenase (ubiquinone) 1 alpha subcomplex subunit 6
MYEIDVPLANIKTKLRQEFERNRYVQDLNIRNALYAKGQMEFQETINFWKQQSHVLKYFQDADATIKQVPPNDFVSRFIKVGLFATNFILASHSNFRERLDGSITR